MIVRNHALFSTHVSQVVGCNGFLDVPIVLHLVYAKVTDVLGKPHCDFLATGFLPTSPILNYF